MASVVMGCTAKYSHMTNHLEGVPSHVEELSSHDDIPSQVERDGLLEPGSGLGGQQCDGLHSQVQPDDLSIQELCSQVEGVSRHDDLCSQVESDVQVRPEIGQHDELSSPVVGVSTVQPW